MFHTRATATTYFDDSTGTEDELVFSHQFGADIWEYSSQYGSVEGVSYTAKNLVGTATRYPAYGDYPETYVPRTYGLWWKRAPCAPPPIPVRESEQDVGQDFVDIVFEICVYPYLVNVFETFNGGSVRRLWAGDGMGNWKLLSEKPKQRSLKYSHIYAPKLGHVNFLTRIIRIELDTSTADYFPEIDAIQLVGHNQFSPLQQSLKLSVRGLTERIVGLGLHKLSPEFDVMDNILQLCDSDPNHRTTSNVSLLEQLPEEVIRTILAHLDLRSLSSLACVSNTLYKAVMDPLLYTSVNLKPYWPYVNRSTLEWLSGRCQLLQQLDLSWCGAYGKLAASDFNWFLQRAGSRLRILRLENCPFLSNESLYRISTICTGLHDLSLRGCRHLETTAFWPLGCLPNLERLVLDDTFIEPPTLFVFLQSFNNLLHLSVASCPNLVGNGSLDEIVRLLSRHQPNILSLDVWRCGLLTTHGMESLVNLTQLKELDISWCGLPPNGNWITRLVMRCRNLQKLFLAAARVVNDSDLSAIAQYCPNMKQLDLLGNNYLSSEGCMMILQYCRNLELLDVSYCGKITEQHVISWKERFPNVSIKQASVPNGV